MTYFDVYVYKRADMRNSDFITSGNRELLFRSHNAIDLQKGQQQRCGAFRAARAS
jgi:hypothetical protein